MILNNYNWSLKHNPTPTIILSENFQKTAHSFWKTAYSLIRFISASSMSKNCISALENGTFIFLTSFFFLSDPRLNLFPGDVVPHGKEYGLVGIHNWPYYTAQDVHNLIDNLDEIYCCDYNRVNNFSQIFISFPWIYCIKIYLLNFFYIIIILFILYLYHKF